MLTKVRLGNGQARNPTIFWLRRRKGLTASEIASIPSMGLTTEGVESVLMRLAAMIRGHLISSSPHREVKGLPRPNRPKKLRGRDWHSTPTLTYRPRAIRRSASDRSHAATSPLRQAD